MQLVCHIEDVVVTGFLSMLLVWECSFSERRVAESDTDRSGCINESLRNRTEPYPRIAGS